MVIHGFLLLGEKKMSKSLGNVLDPFEAIDRFGADALRFYLFREVSFGQDGAVSAPGFEARYETELANDFGNLASRVLAMLARYRDGVVPDAEADPALAGGDGGLNGLPAEVSDLIDRSEPSQALEAIWSRVRRLNRYVEETRPFDLAKDDAQADRLDQVLGNLWDGLRVVTLALLPYIPEAAEKLLTALGEEGRELAEFGSGAGGSRVERIEPLFPKLEAAGEPA
jgi:methionyl-tRNA synthetase